MNGRDGRSRDLDPGPDAEDEPWDSEDEVPDNAGWANETAEWAGRSGGSVLDELD